ncbi:MAG: class I tRNA ligase family protein, partial [Patescibacteria group bacterium]
YDFIWHDFADVYIEYSKTKDTDEIKEILSYVLINTVKILHPFMPFITEEIWSMLPQSDDKEKNLLIIEKWSNI